MRFQTEHNTRHTTVGIGTSGDWGEFGIGASMGCTLNGVVREEDMIDVKMFHASINLLWVRFYLYVWF